MDKASTDDDYFADIRLVVARFFVVAVLFVCNQLVHAVVVTVLHNAFGDLTNLWSYLCAPVVAIVVSKVDSFVSVGF